MTAPPGEVSRFAGRRGWGRLHRDRGRRGARSRGDARVVALGGVAIGLVGISEVAAGLAAVAECGYSGWNSGACLRRGDSLAVSLAGGQAAGTVQRTAMTARRVAWVLGPGRCGRVRVPRRVVRRTPPPARSPRGARGARIGA